MIGRLHASLAIIMIAFSAVSANAQGWAGNWVNGGLLLNDTLDPDRDRWQSSAIYEGFYLLDDGAPLVGFTLGTRTMTPENIAKPNRLHDRPYAELFQLDISTARKIDNFRYDLGLTGFMIGEQTGISNFQAKLHELLSYPAPNIGDHRVDDQFRGAVWGEISYEWISRESNWRFRPYARGQIGPETYLLGGVDILWQTHDLTYLFRDGVTGTPAYYTKKGHDRGFSFMTGFDVKYVYDNIFLETPHGMIDVEPLQYRARIGYQFDNNYATFFFGTTYLSPEFTGQDGGQFVHGMSMQFRY